MIDALTALVAAQHKWGFWLCFDTLGTQGHGWNWKRVYRVYCALGLNLPRRGKKRVLTRARLPLEAPAILNRTWALDFMGDTLYDGRCYRLLTVLDEGNRESLAVEVGTSLPSVRVVQVLEQLVGVDGAPGMLRCDNGPEFIAAALARWCADHGVVLHHIQPGEAEPERVHRAIQSSDLLRRGARCRGLHLAGRGPQVTEQWRELYNTARPHRSLGRVPPRTFLPKNPGLA